MKKNYFILITLVTVLSGLTIQAQTLDEILAKHFGTIGQEKLIQVQSIITKGKLISGNIEIPFIRYSKRPNKTRTEGTFQEGALKGSTFVSAYDGETGWHLIPIIDTLPQQATDEELDELKDQADIDGMLYNYKGKGYTLELAGTENFNGQQVYLLKLTKPNGNVYTHYIDAENYLTLKTVAKINTKGVEQEIETDFSNYKPVEGIILPFNIESKIKGVTDAQYEFDSFTFNQKIDDSIFEMSSKNKINIADLLENSRMNFTGTIIGKDGHTLFKGEGTYLLDKETVIFSYPISKISAQELIVSVEGKSYTFKITPTTKFCKNNKKVSWSSFKTGDMVSSTVTISKKTVKSIRYGPTLFSASPTGVVLKTYKCK